MRDKKLVSNHKVTAHSPSIVEKIRAVPQGGRLADVRDAYGSSYRRLDPGKPSHTVTRSGHHDFIHPTEDRTLTVRELARLQTFPDDWEFLGVRMDSYSSKRQLNMTQIGQVGNAVPPALARAVARSVKEQMFGFRKPESE